MLSDAVGRAGVGRRRRRPTAWASPAAARASPRSRTGAGGQRRVAPPVTLAPVSLAPVRHRHAGGARLRAARRGQGRHLPLRAHRAGRAAHRAHPQGGRLRRPAALAGAVRATRSRSSPTSPTSTTRSWSRRPRPGTTWWALAYANERALHAAYDVLGCLPPTYEPRATGHITEMVELMAELDRARARLPRRRRLRRRLLRRAVLAGRTASCPTSGSTTWRPPRTPTRAASATRATSRSGRATSRASRRPRPGRRRGAAAGRAGTSSARRWSASTSAPSSTSTAAASTCASRTTRTSWPSRRAAGRPFARWWMHNAMLNLGGEKMSKSVGNTMLVSEVVKRVRPVELRYYLVASHYRSVVEFSDEALDEAAAAFRRIEGFVRRAAEVLGGDGRPPAACLRRRSSTAMDDDLVRAGGARGAAGRDPGGQQAARRRAVATRCAATWPSVRAMLDVLGLDPLSPTVGAAGPARPPTCTASSTAGRRSRWRSAPRRGPARTAPRPTRSATS